MDEALAGELLARFASARLDRQAHLAEHGNEVHVPFLQVRNSAVQILPVTVGQLSIESCLDLGRVLAEIVRLREPSSVLLVASTDMSHFVSADEALRLDPLALDCVVGLDARALYQTVAANGISMCGFIPTAVTIEACRVLGKKSAELLAYGHSGQATGDLTSVVGYATAVVS